MPAIAQDCVPDHCRSYLISCSAVQGGVQGIYREKKYCTTYFMIKSAVYCFTFLHKSEVSLAPEQAMGLPAEIFQVLSVCQTT